MATYLQRAQSIGNAIVNGTATLQQIDRLGQAIAYQTGRREQYLTLATEQRAQFVVESIRGYVVGLISSMDGQIASQAAAGAVTQEFKES